ncbi:hypothetical protein DFH27DRAFT_613610 [Peziza echinospora]|nr:hypothetical protein DFH27DRAFT_613610 [Peziza echinospora]
MEGWLARPSREGLDKDDTGKVDEEEDWSRIGDDGGGGRASGMRGRIADSIGPIIRLFPGLKRRGLGQWHQPRQLPPISHNAAEVVVSEIINSIVPSTSISVPVLDRPADATTSTEPVGVSTSSVVDPTSPPQTPTPAPAPPAPTTTILTTSSTPTLPAQSFTTITSTIIHSPSNITTNLEQITQGPITNGNTVIIFTTHTQLNKTNIQHSTGTRTVTVTQSAPSSTAYETTQVWGGGGGGSGGDWTEVSASATPTGQNDEVGGGSGGGGAEPAPVQPRLLGGIFGGVAGVALIVLAIFMLFKRHKRLRAIQAIDDAGYGGPMQGPSGPSIVSRSISFLGAGVGARHHHRSAAAAAADPEPAERGFVKVAGRKLPPAIGGPRPEFGSMRSNAQSTSSYTGGADDSIGTAAAGSSGRSSHNIARYSSGGSTRAINPFHSPPASPPPPSSMEYPSTRPPPPPPPPRSPSTQTPPLATKAPPPPPPPPRLPYHRQLSLTGADGVGRSLASHDGSRGSRFTEDIA